MRIISEFQTQFKLGQEPLTQLQPAEAGGLLSRLEVALTLKRYYADYPIYEHRYDC